MRVEILLAAGVLSTGLMTAPALAGGAPPSLELLEFLGSFETADGHWLDPTLLATPGLGVPAGVADGKDSAAPTAASAQGDRTGSSERASAHAPAQQEQRE